MYNQTQQGQAKGSGGFRRTCEGGGVMGYKFVIKKISAGNDEYWQISKDDEGYEDTLIVVNKEHMDQLVSALKERGY